MTDKEADDLLKNNAWAKHSDARYLLQQAAHIGYCQALAQAKELRALVQGIVDERHHCFIPNDLDGTLNWDERARKALNT
jgi:hypothetical protein